jgi:hypothetical protein
MEHVSYKLGHNNQTNNTMNLKFKIKPTKLYICFVFFFGKLYFLHKDYILIFFL